MDQHTEQPILDKITPTINIYDLPPHNPKKFIDNETEIKIVIEDEVEVGFTLFDVFYEFDYEEGFFEQNGCYYTRKYEPMGWWVKDKHGEEFFYDINGRLDGEFEGGSDEEQMSLIQ